jgi:hypothetical protein
MLETHVKSAVLAKMALKKSNYDGSAFFYFLNASRNHEVIAFVLFK